MPDTKTDVHLVPFPEWAVRAFLDSRKDQFRVPCNQDFRMPMAERVNRCSDYTFDFIFEDDTGMLRPPPYGKPGTEVAVQEAFRLPSSYEELSAEQYVQTGGWQVQYDADGQHTLNGAPDHAPPEEWGRLRPAEEMPRELTRIRLRVEDVGVERACEISEPDARAEDVEVPTRPSNAGYRTGFYHKWTAHYGEDAWEQFCWVYDVSRIDDK